MALTLRLLPRDSSLRGGGLTDLVLERDLETLLRRTGLLDRVGDLETLLGVLRLTLRLIGLLDLDLDLLLAGLSTLLRRIGLLLLTGLLLRFRLVGEPRLGPLGRLGRESSSSIGDGVRRVPSPL